MSRIPEFQDGIDKMVKIHETKNEDYASENNPFSNFDVSEYGLQLFNSQRDKTFVWPIFTKLARLANLLNGSKRINHESIEDTFIDIANYLLLWRADYMRRTEIEKAVEKAEKGIEQLELSNSSNTRPSNTKKLN